MDAKKYQIKLLLKKEKSYEFAKRRPEEKRYALDA